MNKLAESFGYTMGSPAKDFDKVKDAERLRVLAISREHIVHSLVGKGFDKRVIERTVDNFIRTYSKELMSGEYSILTLDDLIALGKGTIVDEKCQVIVWSKQVYLSWEEMEEL